MLNWTDSNLNEGGAEERTLDAKDLKVGMFGDFLEARQHGTFVQWEPGPTGHSLKPCRTPGPRAVSSSSQRL